MNVHMYSGMNVHMVFGHERKAFMHIPKENLIKLYAKSTECILIGYCDNQKAYWLFEKGSSQQKRAIWWKSVSFYVYFPLNFSTRNSDGVAMSDISPFHYWPISDTSTVPTHPKQRRVVKKASMPRNNASKIKIFVAIDKEMAKQHVCIIKILGKFQWETLNGAKFLSKKMLFFFFYFLNKLYLLTKLSKLFCK